MSITIKPDLEALLRARAEAEGLSVENYIERIARSEQQAEEEIETLALEGLNSGEPLNPDDKYWAEKTRRLMGRHPPGR